MPNELSRGTKIRIVRGSYAKRTGTIDSKIYGRTVDHPDQMSIGYGVILDDGEWILVKQDQVVGRFQKSLDRRVG